MRLATLLLSLLLCINADAQKVKVKESVRQDWSGGIAGKRGTNYNFTLEIQGAKESFIVDSLWIDDKPIALIYNSDVTPGNCTLSISGKSILLKINTGVSNNDNDLPSIGIDKPQEIKPNPPLKYNGVALVCYKYGDKRGYYTIEKIITTLPTQNYP